MSDAQTSESNRGGVPKLKNMENHLDRRRKDILAVLQSIDDSPHHSGEINTSDLREAAGVPSGSMTNHRQKLERIELIKEVDREYAGGGDDAVVWQLTDTGRTFCEGYLDDIRTIPTPGEVTALRERVSKLETRIEDMQQQHEDDMDDLEDRVVEMVKSINAD